MERVVVVTRHSALVQLLKELQILKGEAEIISHVLQSRVEKQAFQVELEE